MPNQVVSYVLSLKDAFSAQISKANAEAQKLENTVNETQGSLNGLAGMATKAFAAIGVASFGRAVLEVGQNFENAEMGLTTLLKSGEKAKEVFNAIQQDAATTPFDFQSLLMANKALISAGASATQARGDVLNLANAIAATGGGNDELQRMVVNLQQIKNTGKATALDIKQFAYAGVNIYQLLADATGKNVKEVQDMEVSYETLTFALQKASQQGGAYFNGLTNAMNTTQGQISNLGDQFDMLKNDIFNGLKPAISSVISGLSSLIGFIRENKTGLTALGIAVTGLTIAWNANTIAMKLAAFWQGATKAGTILNTLAIVAQEFAVGGLTGAWTALSVAMSANPIGLVIAGVAALAAGIYYAYQKADALMGILKGVWAVIKGIAQGDFNIVDNFQKARGEYIGKIIADKNKGNKNTLSDAAKAATTTTNKIQPTSSSGSKSSNVQTKANQATVINININKLIESQTIKIDNAAKDMTQKIQKAVADALLMAVNDANRIATQ